MENLHEPAAEAYGDGENELVEPPFGGVLAEACSAIVDEIAAVERNQAKLKAWQVELIDEAVRLAEVTEHSVLTVGSTLSATQRREMARRSVVAELACALRMPEGTVVGMVADADALMHRLPATMDALRAGEISYRHARVLIDQTQTLPPDVVLALEGQALPFARTLTVSKFAAKTRLVREQLDPESITARLVKSARDRRLEFQPAPDGMAWLSLYTTSPEASSLFRAVRDHAVRVQNPADPRTLAQLTADVATDALFNGMFGNPDADADAQKRESLAGSGSTARSAVSPTSNGANGSTRAPFATLGSGTAFSRIRPTVMVTVPALTLLGLGDEPGTLEGCGPIDPVTARALAGQSTTWYRMLTDPKTGAPVAIDDTRYRPTKAMRRYLGYVDGTCRFAGCGRAARHCDLDHTKDHQFDGRTRCENLSHLCRKHHRLKHQTTWQVQQRGQGTLEWTSPGGRTYLTQPEVLLANADPPRPPHLQPLPSPTLLQSPKALPPGSAQPPKALPLPPTQPPKALPPAKPHESDDLPPF